MSARKVLNIRINNLIEAQKQIIDDFIDKNEGNDIYITANGEYEILCSELISEYHSRVGRDHIKVWNWYPEAEGDDKDRFVEWFISQIGADEIWALDSSSLSICNIESAKGEFFLSSQNKNKRYLRQVARSVADSTLFSEIHNVYIDLSDAVNTEFVTGIQRVCYALVDNVNQILRGREDYIVCPVYSEPGENLVKKCRIVDGRYRPQLETSVENVVQFHDGDYLLMPDISILNVSTKRHYYNRLHNRGVKVYTLLHDIIPIRYPEYYSLDHVQVFTEYAEAISHFSGIIANSMATRDDYKKWLCETGISLRDDFLCEFFHLGCDLENANPTKIRKNEDLQLIEVLKSKTTFLVVATIEPRKMHEQVLKAFEVLWDENRDINLVFVGKYGWQMEQLAAYINKHPRLDKNLFWLQGVSDEYLDMLYDASSAVIAASVIEGFGLPIIEAANHGKYLILRDIPVFREVAGDAAFYFDTFDEKELACDIEEWLELYERKELNDSSAVECLNWMEASRRFLECAGID